MSGQGGCVRRTEGIVKKTRGGGDERGGGVRSGWLCMKN